MSLLVKRKPKTKPENGDLVKRVTVDGNEIEVTVEVSKKLGKKKPCNGGLAFGCRKFGPHRARYQKFYDDADRKLRNVRLTYEESMASYICTYCKQWLGCMTCAGDIGDLLCRECKTYANKISFRRHGRIIRDKETLNEAWKIVDMRYRGRVNQEEAEALFSELFSLKGSCPR